jgi:hypothetical protein
MVEVMELDLTQLQTETLELKTQAVVAVELVKSTEAPLPVVLVVLEVLALSYFAIHQALQLQSELA